MVGILVLFSVADAPRAGQESPGTDGGVTGHWRAELVSSGGITGRGTGGVAVSSDGTALLLQFGPRGAGQERGAARGGAESNVDARFDVTVTCTTTLSRPRITALDRAVSNIAPEHWRAGALQNKPAPCCDLLEWKLTVTREEEQLVSSWAADSAKSPEVPAAVADVHEALLALWPTVRSACSTNR